MFFRYWSNKSEHVIVEVSFRSEGFLKVNELKVKIGVATL